MMKSAMMKQAISLLPNHSELICKSIKHRFAMMKRSPVILTPRES